MCEIENEEYAPPSLSEVNSEAYERRFGNQLAITPNSVWIPPPHRYRVTEPVTTAIRGFVVMSFSTC